MRKLPPAEWEKKYVVGPIEQFDQKYTMFNRPIWDPEVTGMLDDWSFNGEPEDKPGYGTWEHSLDRASWAATQLGVFNSYKPNPRRSSMAMLGVLNNGQPPPPRKSRAQADVSDPAAAARNIKKAARFYGADIVGVCELDQRWVYSHSYEDLSFMGGTEKGESRPQTVDEVFKYGIVMGFDMDYQMMKRYPSYIAAAVTGMGYSRMVIASNALGAFIRGLGFQTIDCSTNDVVLSIPLALQAGLGDLARNGLLVTPELGPRLRLTIVLTDLPLVPDEPIEFGVTEFCQSCKKCSEQCPSQAILHGDRTTEPRTASNSAGELKWPVHAEKCRMYWSRMDKVCCTCIACCPYNKPDTLFHRTVRRLTDYARWADPLYVKADDLFGYGRPVKPQNFWEDWQPRRQQPRLL